MSNQELLPFVANFGEARIMVIGDLMVDEYIWGSVSRISPEAPVPVVWANKRTYVPGGAANVANNLRSLGAKVTLAGVVGKDHNRDIMASQLGKKGIDTGAVITEPGRHTTLKTRIFARNQQMVRVDWEHTDPINKTKDLWKDNWDLSAQRALAVVRYLQGHGISDKLIRAVGCGEARPVDTNTTTAGKAKNRRVEIVVYMR